MSGGLFERWGGVRNRKAYVNLDVVGRLVSIVQENLEVVRRF